MLGEEIHAWSLLRINGSTVSSSGYQLPHREQVVGGEGWNHYHKMIELIIRSRVSKVKVTKYKCSNCLKQCLFLSVVDMHVSCPVMLLAKDMIKTQSANFLATDIVIMLFHSVIGVLLVSKVLFTINLYLDCQLLV